MGFTLLWERHRRKQIPFQMVLKAYAGKTLHNTTETKGQRAVLHLQKVSLGRGCLGRDLLK